MKQATKDKRNLLYNGVTWSMADAFTMPFLVPLGLALGASKIVIGTITSLQNLGMLLSQVPGSEIVWIVRKRRAVNNVCEFLAKTSWLAIVLIPFLPADSWLTVLLAAVFLSSFFVNLSYPAWTSFLADVVPKEIRGRYFANRNTYMGLASIIVTIFVGFYLDIFPKGSLLGFSSIFLFGFVFGILAIIYFALIRGSKLRLPQHHLHDYLNIRGNFGRLLAFNAYFGFAYMIASPFFAVYMLQNLGMGYADYALFSAIAAFAGLVSQKHWGALIDKFGARPTMFIGVVGAAFVPLLFIFVTPSTLLWLIPVQILSGVAWAGVGLINFNMFLDTTDDEKRVFQTADYNIITTLPMIFAPIIGGYIAENWTLAMAGIPLLFLISTILRLSALPLLSRIKEPHVKREYATSFVLRQFVTVHPARGLAHEIRTANKEIKHLVRKL